MDTVISISNLNKHFKGKPALNDISLSISRGETVALIGASGSGKSTLLRHIAGLLTTDKSGQKASGCDLPACCVSVLGQTIQEDGQLAKKVRQHRARVGFIFQQFNLVNRMSVLNNVVLGALARVPGWRGALNWFPKSEQLVAMRALQRVGMDSFASQRASTLSGGQQQRVAIARALVQGAEVLLADEPVASLDPESSRRVLDTLTKVSKQDQKTVVISLHQVEYARQYCTRVIALKKGRVVFDGPTADLTLELLNELYGSESLNVHGLTPDASEPNTIKSSNEMAKAV
ncbi:MAG: phosphonate ABC transporter ATP-binding protein [Gammaproteobacteria bacterium]|nr:phosphonate ABC transporter ATP-binding protein [Gammaproteobacteria bacterium]